MSYELICSVPYVQSGSEWVCTGLTSTIQRPVSFDVSSLDPASVVSAIGSGFIVAGIPLLVIFLSRLVINQIR